MDIFLKRKWFTNKSTMGVIATDFFKCYTLEDVARPIGVKIKNITCIPVGIYDIIITYSNRFKRDMPLVLKVPMFSGVRIHCGNTGENTSGCILVGKNRGIDVIYDCKDVFIDLFVKIKLAIDGGDIVRLVVTNEQEEIG